MSLPRELLDELLSGFMDGELSADERARVEQMLATDPAVRKHLRTLQEQSEGVRTAIRTAPGLDGAFAERVLAATFAEAARTGVAENHPVRLAAAAPAHASRHVSRWGWRAIGGLAVAASLAAAVTFLREGEGQPPRLATGEPTVDEPLQNEATAAPHRAEGIAAAEDGRDERGEAAGEGSADAEGIAFVDPQSDASEGESLAGIAPATTPVPETDSVRETESATENPSSESGNALALDEPAARDELAALPSADGQSALRAVLVYQVQVTPLGREQGVINRAFREADIRIANQREVDDALVGYLQSSELIGGEAGEPTDDGDRVSVIFLEGSGKQLEKLMLRLLSSGDEIRSVGFSLAMDPPVMAAIDSLEQIDPTMIRGDTSGAVAHSLIPADGAEAPATGASARFTPGDRSFMPLRRDSLAGLSSASDPTAEDQSDITARTLLIVRFE